MTESLPKTNNHSGRKVLLGIVGTPVLVIVLSSLLFYLVDNQAVELGTVNNGELVSPPLQFAEAPLKTLSGEKFSYDKPEPKWSFVVFGDNECLGDCERMLYVARQSRTALGRDMNRIRLHYVTTAQEISNELQQRLQQEYKEIQVIVLSEAELQQLFTGSAANPLAEKTFYVVDPRGWLMMFYRAEDTEQTTLNDLGKAVVRDMKRLFS